MSPALKYLKSMALTLPEDEVCELIDALVERNQTQMTDDDIAWFEEAIKRSDAMQNEGIAARDAYEVLEDVYKKVVLKK